MISCLCVGLGGFIGAVLRYLIGLIPMKLESGFPLKTFLINIIGSFAIGLIAAIASKNSSINPNLILFLKVGICGGFTTFSSFALETSDLIQSGNTVLAIVYATLSMFLGMLAVLCAEIIVK